MARLRQFQSRPEPPLRRHSDQGQRLDWLNSGVIVADAHLLARSWWAAAGVRRRPNRTQPWDLSFLTGETLSSLPGRFRFQVRSLIDSCSHPGIPRQYPTISSATNRPCPCLGGAADVLGLVWLVAWLAIHTNSCLILTGWAHPRGGRPLDVRPPRYLLGGQQFRAGGTLLAGGFACTYIGLVGSIVLAGARCGRIDQPCEGGDLSEFMHFIRIFGGQVGVVAMAVSLCCAREVHFQSAGTACGRRRLAY